MTAPRPYSEKPRWDEVGAITTIGGAIVVVVGVVVGWPLAAASGVATILAGVIIRAAASIVWSS